jgi:hypothetical protein
MTLMRGTDILLKKRGNCSHTTFHFTTHGALYLLSTIDLTDLSALQYRINVADDTMISSAFVSEKLKDFFMNARYLL